MSENRTSTCRAPFSFAYCRTSTGVIDPPTDGVAKRSSLSCPASPPARPAKLLDAFLRNLYSNGQEIRKNGSEIEKWQSKGRQRSGEIRQPCRVTSAPESTGNSGFRHGTRPAADCA